MNRKPGFTMIEVLVAMVVLAIGLLGMAGMTVLVMRGNRGAVDMTAATSVCQKKIEELKNLSWDEVGTGVDAGDSLLVGAENAVMVQDGSLRPGGGLNSQGLTAQDFFVQENTVSASPCEGAFSGQNWELLPGDDVCRKHIVDAGPYKFARTFVVCKGTDYSSLGEPPADSTYNPATDNPYPGVARGTFEWECRVDPKANESRTKSVACLPADITTATGSNNAEKKLKVMCAWRDSDGSCHAVHAETTIVRF